VVDSLGADHFIQCHKLILVIGGTAAAAGKLVELSEANIMGYLFMIDIINLKGTILLGDKPIITLIEHDEEE
jgi:adenine phosphoribosyltransferase